MKPSLECGFCPSSYNRVPDGIVRDIVEVWSRLRQFISFPTTTESGVVLMKDFFISYNSTDRTWAEWIAWQLEEAEYTTVLQAWDFRPDSDFVFEQLKSYLSSP
jgi:hypothetical protein